MMSLMTLSICLLFLFVFLLRGGGLHNHLVCEVEKILQTAGCKTRQEYPLQLPEGELDFVDLLAEGNGFVLCVEVETSSRHVVDNARKARQLNLPLLVIVPNRKVQKSARKKLETAGIHPQNNRIYILLLGQLKQKLTTYLPLITLANGDGGKRVIKHPKGS